MVQIYLPSEFNEFLQLLNETRVEYLLVGGWALAVHGHPRFTGDIDFWIERSPANAARVIEALRRFDIDDPALTPELVQSPGKILRLGVPPMRIEVLNQIDGVEFASCYGRRVRVSSGGVQVDVIGRDDLIVNKRASGRPKDLADLAALGERDASVE